MLAESRPLNREEGAALKARADAGDADALDVLARSVFPIAVKMAAAYWRRDYVGRVGLSEAISAAMLGTAEALKRYDPARGPFFAIARLCIQHELVRLFRVETAYEQTVSELASPEELVDDSAERPRELVEAADVLDGLSRADRELAWQHFIRGTPSHVIAARRGVSRWAMGKRIAALRERLIARMGG